MEDKIEEKAKPIHAKPSLYAFYFEVLKEIALKYGYNLVLHGSMNRDLDLIAVPWQKKLGSHDEMIEEFITQLGGDLQYGNGVPRSLAVKYGEKIDESWLKYNVTHHGRLHYIININRERKVNSEVGVDPQYYIDISVIPPVSSFKSQLIERIEKEHLEKHDKREQTEDKDLKILMSGELLGLYKALILIEELTKE